MAEDFLLKDTLYKHAGATWNTSKTAIEKSRHSRGEKEARGREIKRRTGQRSNQPVIPKTNSRYPQLGSLEKETRKKQEIENRSKGNQLPAEENRRGGSESGEEGRNGAGVTSL